MAPAVTVSLLAVFIAAIVDHIIGFVVFASPLGGIWREGMIKDKGGKAFPPKGGGMAKPMAVGFVTGLLRAYIMSHCLAYVSATSPVDGAIAGFWLWLGFVACHHVPSTVWQSRPAGLVIIDEILFFTRNVAMGAVLANPYLPAHTNATIQ